MVTGTPQVLMAEGLSNTFDGARFQFEDLQLTVCRGQKLGLVGINGCGKSTLLKVCIPWVGCVFVHECTRVRRTTLTFLPILNDLRQKRACLCGFSSPSDYKKNAPIFVWFQLFFFIKGYDSESQAHEARITPTTPEGLQEVRSFF